jgi:probable biosynthetic protein (TIGR04098 family)
MAIIQSIADKLAVRILGRNEYESLSLRRYFDRRYGIKVGLYSIGAFDRWRIPPGTLVGRYCSIAKSARLIDANHPMDALSTHPFFYLKEFGIVGEDQAVLRPPVVEDDVWLGHNSVIMPSCHRIGRGAVIGAGAVVMADVPPYAIMAGAPARLVRYRFSPDLIDAIEASQWWLLDKDQLRQALSSARGFALTPSRDTALAFLAATGRDASFARRAPEAPVEQPAIVGAADAGAKHRILDILRQEILNFTDEAIDRPFQELEIDSFGLINLRTAIERTLGRPIPDRVWGLAETPADVLVMAGAEPSRPAPKATTSPAPTAPETGSISRPGGERRIQHVNMPQMAMSGLSESWTFKEIGDLHWSVLTRGLRTPSSEVSDSEGDRLYATFTRLRLSSDIPLMGFVENEELTIDLDMTRYGAGMYFSTAELKGEHGIARAQLMTSFSKRGEAGSNTSLLKGQPLIPDDCEIPSVPELPAFAAEYRAQRALEPAPALFECEYEIVPPHDINGVGLLYFAAYPMIIDICAGKSAGRALFSDFSTVLRDVFYFANSMPDETLIFRIHAWEERGDTLAFDASLSRKSDGKTMAFVRTEKRRLGPGTVKAPSSGVSRGRRAAAAREQVA